MKFLLRFFISALVFLLSGYGQMHANSDRESINCASIENLQKSNAILDLVQNSETTTFKALHSYEQADSKFRATDNEGEEDELSSGSKKSLELNNYFTIAFSAKLPVSFYHHVKKSLPVSELFINFSSYRKYIVFRVIRI
jgi:hypothetical protein